MYDVKTTADLQDALKDLLGGTIQSIYHAPDEQTARKQLEVVREKWEQKYPGCMKRWSDNWEAVSPRFKFSRTVREVMYTTNAIESLNSCYRRLNRSIFPSDTALEKAIWLATWEMTKKWTMPMKNWGQVYAELSIVRPEPVCFSAA